MWFSGNKKPRVKLEISKKHVWVEGRALPRITKATSFFRGAWSVETLKQKFTAIRDEAKDHEYYGAIRAGTSLDPKAKLDFEKMEIGERKYFVELRDMLDRLYHKNPQQAMSLLNNAWFGKTNAISSVRTLETYLKQKWHIE